jgi:hypothetical protein
MLTTHVQVRLSTLRYLSKNLRLSTATKRLQSAPVTGMPASFSCQRSLFRSTASDRNISAPGGAQHRFGADTANSNKKPGVERRACPSFRLGWLLVAQSPERMCSKLVLFQVPGIRNQPHLVVSGRARFVRGLPCKSGLRQHPGSIAPSCISSSLKDPFFWRAPLWNSWCLVEIDFARCVTTQSGMEGKFSG